MGHYQPGTRLRSAVCATEVVIIAAPPENVELSCGGAPLLAEGDEASPDMTIDANAAAGSLLGKRYTDASGKLELLCVKPGAGSLAAGGIPLVTKSAKPLPASD